MIEDTRKADPYDKLLTAWPGGGGIEAQEAMGARQMVSQSDEWVQIPAKIQPGGGTWEEFKALGFELGPLADPYERSEDELFRKAKLPEGWSFDRSGHSMWTYIVDEKGFRRVSVFYKAAFYDRRADMRLNRVPTTKAQEDTLDALYPPGIEDYWTVIYPQVREGDDIISVFKPRFDRDREDKDWVQRRRVRVAADGAMLEDESYEVSPEQAIEDARK